MEQMAMLDELVVLSTLRRARLSITAAEDEERQAVLLARRAGWSWDRVGRELHTPGETLRRHYASSKSSLR